MQRIVRPDGELQPPTLSIRGNEISAVRVTAVAIAAAAAIALPGAADASWTIRGRGFGHGVGLSQYGALGLAEHGRGYRQILSHYYSHTRLGRDHGSVRVLLGSGEGEVAFSGARRACGHRLRPARRYAFGIEAGKVALRRPGHGRIAGCGGEGRAGSGIEIDGLGRYRGSLVARATGGNMLVINQLGSEAYVRGVVANEVPASWPAASLQAQAVVARSYGLATRHDGPFDQYADTRSQVYGGRDSETRRTDRAVKATSRRVVTHRGRPAVTYYFSTSGGRTEDARFGFSGGESVPYLRSVDDPFDSVSPVHRWRERLSNRAIESRLSGLFEGGLRRIEVVKTGRSPRIVLARLVGSEGSSTVSGETLRSRLELRSTWARFRRR